MLFKKLKKLYLKFMIALEGKNIGLGGKKAGAVERFGGAGRLAVKVGQCFFVIGRMRRKDPSVQRAHALLWLAARCA